MRILQVTSVSKDVLDAVNLLLPQLSTSSKPLDLNGLGRVVEDLASTLFIAKDDDESILGMLTLVEVRIPTGYRVIIEDVVVDSAGRGKGVGEALVKAALEKARQDGCSAVELTSRPSRDAANRLYLRMGFTPRETNVYRYVLD
ncbi:MAG: GNAT family N-acetyltransferase [Acidimicrobiales bacterium]|nr:GNAT family N-acetyltransferase [Acidimicrobiales bacterium]